ncbi:PHD finger protein 6 [Merluccius polli]|uniref:PHD finger protein 6 n=1 Tax=Merluccius polli TaxID=89951 RepID=A0AA47NP43_MERPO|nr:PHD finger protein 6 [Merluccius polli]
MPDLQLYSSGIICEYSPEFDDLFGFSVEDVKTEAKRGTRLVGRHIITFANDNAAKCDHCGKSRATVGCEVRRCTKSFHYPCAVQGGAEHVEDETNGKFTVYCSKHRSHIEGANGHVDRTVASAGTSDTPTRDTSKALCQDRERIKGTTNLENVRSDILIQQETPSKRSTSAWKRKILEDTSDEEDAIKDMIMSYQAPIESDLEDIDSSTNSSQGRGVSGTWDGFNGEIQVSSLAEMAQIWLLFPYQEFTESMSLLLPVTVCYRSDNSETIGSPISRVSPIAPGSPPSDHAAVASSSSSSPHPTTLPSKRSPTPAELPPLAGLSSAPGSSSAPRPSSAPGPSSAPRPSSAPGPSSAPRPSSAPGPSPAQQPSSAPETSSTPGPSRDAVSFWKNCNKAGNTQAIFSHFIAQIKSIASKIQTGQASHEECDVALQVMEVSGQLTKLLEVQEEELQEKICQLQRAADAMKKAISVANPTDIPRLIGRWIQEDFY